MNKDIEITQYKTKVGNKQINMYKTQYKTLKKLGIDHGYFSTLDIELNRENFNKKEFENIFKKNLDNYVYLNLEHGDNIEEVNSLEDIEKVNIKKADGVKSKFSIPLLTTSADCISYIVLDNKNKVLYNIHSGWKGVQKRIVIKAVKQCLENTNSKDIFVFSFPAILKCHFEVKQDVFDIFGSVVGKIIEKYDLDKNIKQDFLIQKEDKLFVDLVGINTLELNLLGVNVFDSGLCSFCNNDKFNSARCGNLGRNYLYAKLI